MHERRDVMILKTFEPHWLRDNWEKIGQGLSHLQPENKVRSGDPFVNQEQLRKYYAIYVVALNEHVAGRFRLCALDDTQRLIPLQYIDAHVEKPEGFLSSDVLRHGGRAVPGGVSEAVEFEVYGLSWNRLAKNDA
ncbi:hypothetical protein [Pseudomonas cremoricolorata]|uniref:Uncharacterized protein n=1 Tax=Pseudomonas cremoricolorata TaxID=157783 RepID=A0A089WPF2_9PSED|nr:hypothetical protein [Pseudomonas cremoricolorata]AIR88367.1 hypothetical protein LK03_03520 [Pseudomonas cremoricolorata]